MTTKILAISGSLRRASSNTAILEAAIIHAPEGTEIKLFSGLDLLPHFNPDREQEIIPPLEDFRRELKNAHALLICSPEYAHGIPGTLKNALDWIVGSSELDQMPIGIINATPLYAGKNYAQESLVEILKTMSAIVLPENALSISSVKSKLDENNKIKDAQTLEDVTKLISSLKKIAKRA